MPVTFPSRGVLSRHEVIPTEAGAVRRPVSYDWSGAVTGATVLAPPSGRRIFLDSGTYRASAPCTFRLFFDTDVAAQPDGSGRVDEQSPDGSGWAGNPHWAGWRIGPVDGVLRITTTAAGGSLALQAWTAP